MTKKSDAPAIRFKGFSDAWEQRKLGEVIRLNGRIGFRGYTEKIEKTCRWRVIQ